MDTGIVSTKEGVDTTFLVQFFNTASTQSYASLGSLHAAPWKQGFREFQVREGDWLYRDSFQGHRQSWGQETIWHAGAPIWVQNYGGGVEDRFSKDDSLISEILNFLKMCLREKGLVFQPRGPRRMYEGSFVYETEFAGSVQKFHGKEYILHKDLVVFSHSYSGGLIV